MPQPSAPSRLSDLPGHNELAAMRTLMAAKRTFLAWCRTAMALMGFGFILEKMTWYMKKDAGIQLHQAIHEMGLLSLFAFCAGGLIILLEGLRMARTSKRLSCEHTRHFHGSELVLVVAVAVIMVVCFLYSMDILIVPRSTP